MGLTNCIDVFKGIGSFEQKQEETRNCYRRAGNLESVMY